MAVRGDEVHVETDEARGGSTPHIVRWILVISTLGAIVLLSAVWIFGAATQGDTEDEITATSVAQEREQNSGIDGVVIDNADEIGATAEDPLNTANETDAVPATTNGGGE